MTFGSDIVTITTADEVYTANPDGSCPTTTPIESVGPQIVVCKGLKTKGVCQHILRYRTTLQIVDPTSMSWYTRKLAHQDRAGSFKNRLDVRNGNPLSAVQRCRKCRYGHVPANMQEHFPDSHSKLSLPNNYSKLKRRASATISDHNCANFVFYGVFGSNCYRLQYTVSRIQGQHLVPRLTTYSIGPEGSTACECTPGGETEMQFGDTCGTSTYLPSEPCPTA